MDKHRMPSENELAAWIGDLPLAAWQKDLQLRYRASSPAWAALLGQESGAALLGRQDTTLLPPWDAQRLLRDDLQALAHAGNSESEFDLCLPDGSLRRLRCQRRCLHDSSGALIGLQGFMQDISQELLLARRLKEQENRQNSWLRALQDHALLCTMDRQGRITYVSASLARLLGQLPDTLVGQRRPQHWLPAGMELRYYLALAEQGNPASFEFSGTHPHGNPYHLRSLIIALNRASEQEQVFFELITDLSQEKSVTASLSRANDQLLRVLQDNTELITQLEVTARTDPLTGLMNRRAFFERAAQEVARSARNHQPLALLMLDIDFFKRINDTHGHEAGDRALVRLADVLRGQLRNIDVLARMGGEEFALLLPDTDQVAAPLIAERLRQAVAQQTLGSGEAAFGFTVSLGVAARQPDEPIDTLLNRADKALYKAKHAGRNRVCLAANEPDGAQDAVS
ncbi:GGDEF domain-containing protein [Chitinilyticum litopenaei]|uniref:GGDEF domain-containing protein n=1 Tax=Chitinilyticum litopenaei TaxID=1121276 RepID=UPI000685FEF4|nr:sensor domain-containing diguanylate cyclase [Chitinilyticum litopenaei]